MTQTSAGGVEVEANPPDGEKSRRRYWPLVRLLVGLSIIAGLLASGRLNLHDLAGLRLGLPLAILVAVCGLAHVLNSLRWVSLVGSMGTPSQFWNLFGVSLASTALIYVSPAGAGADAARTIYLNRTTDKPLAAAAGISLLDRLVGLQTLLLVVGILGTVAAPLQNRLLFFAALLAAAILFAVTWRLAPRLTDGRGSLRTAYMYSIAGSGANLAVPILGLAALTERHISLESLSVSGQITLINSVAPTPGGLGVGEGAAAGLLAEPIAAAGMFAARAVLILWSLIFGLIYALRSPDRLVAATNLPA